MQKPKATGPFYRVIALSFYLIRDWLYLYPRSTVEIRGYIATEKSEILRCDGVANS